MAARSIAVGVAAAALAAGCGKGLVPGTTYDRPLLTITGSLKPAGGLRNVRDRANAGPPRHPVMTLLWVDPLQRGSDLPAPAHTVHSSVSAEDDSFTLEIFRTPPPDALIDYRSPAGDSATVAVAEIVAIDDRDGDGTFRPSGERAEIAEPDLYLGGSTTMLTYLARPFATPQPGFPLTATNTPGFDLVGYRCQGPFSPGTARIAAGQVELVLQPSVTLPEVRDCRRSHTP